VTTSESGEIMGDMLNAKENGLDSLYDFLESDKIVLKGSSGKDTFTAYAKNDKLDGGAGADTLNAAGGNDRIIGGLGNDKLTGGAGSDTFFFKAGHGADKITDFEAGRAGGDVIEFAKGLFSNYADVLGHAADTASGVKISYDGGSVTLLGVELADLHKSDFHLL
jgi:Ca2+-binding RTX toxin-like protein